jgi:pimeloyl-ACP methyl ester carboxylesterase/DNA-binding SARP family transcriptional activator
VTERAHLPWDAVSGGFQSEPIQFAYSGRARLAFQVFGNGPNLVAIPPTAQHIEMAWEAPEIKAMLEQFGSFSRYLHFDKRGTGASDRRSQVSGIDERVEDLRAIMDHAGMDHAHVFACSEGGPMAILFAATYPDRVDGLIFHGAYAAQGSRSLNGDLVPPDRDRLLEYCRRWGTDESPVVEGFAPTLASNQRFADWHRRYERSAADSDSLLDVLELAYQMDVRELLPRLEVPTLVLHRKGDRAVSIELGRELAEHIPGARLVELDGDDHFQYAGDVAAWMDEVERLVTGSVSPRVTFKPRAEVKISTLGRFSVSRGGVEVPTSAWGSRLARQICKRLVAARGWPVTREHLIDMCWPDESDRRRLGARLSVQLSSVRRVLGGGVIADRSSVRLDVDQVQTDLETYFAADDDMTIVAAYEGEFLPDDLYEDWTRPMRDETRTRFVTAGHRLAESTSDLERRIWLAQRLIACDRYDETAHRLLVTTLLAMGEAQEAERAHGAWTSALSELEVEIEPLGSLGDI